MTAATEVPVDATPEPGQAETVARASMETTTGSWRSLLWQPGMVLTAVAAFLVFLAFLVARLVADKLLIAITLMLALLVTSLIFGVELIA